MNRLKSMLTVFGAVAFLVLAANGVSVAATGKPLLLGKGNSAGAATTLTRTTPGPVLSLKGKTATAAPMTVNSRGKVANLNADTVDGIDSSTLLRTRTYVYARQIAAGDASSMWEYVLPGLPAGTYQIGFSVFPNGSVVTGDTITCYITTRNSGGTAIRYVGEDRSVSVSNLRPSSAGTGIVEFGAGQSVSVRCDASFAFYTFASQPIQIYATPTTYVGGSSNTLTARTAPAAKQR